LREELRWEVDGGSEYDKVGVIFGLNTVRSIFAIAENPGPDVLDRFNDGLMGYT
jgi:hypothetical protein